MINRGVFRYMKSCEFVTFISVLACSIAEGKTQDELNLLSAIFTQLRRYLSDNCSMQIRRLKEKFI